MTLLFDENRASARGVLARKKQLYGDSLELFLTLISEHLLPEIP
jgi:hypothetical protein